MAELVDMASQFKGLPMGDLIGGPLTAACEAQLKLAGATATFIKTIGFLPPDKGSTADVGDVRLARFAYTRTIVDPEKPGEMKDENMHLDVPMLAIVKVPNLSVTKVDITFDMEVKSSFSSTESEDKKGAFAGDGRVGWGCLSVNVHVEGSVASHKENTRTSDNSAKYHVQVLAEDNGMPEGLARVLDILQQSIQPRVKATSAATPT